MLKLPADVLDQVAQGKLTLGHAKALLVLAAAPAGDGSGGASDPLGQEYSGQDGAARRAELISAVAFKVVNGELSVRKTEELVTAVLTGDKKKEEKPAPPVDPNVKNAQEKLQAALGMKVVIEDHKGRGKVVISYSSLDDFDVLLKSFGAGGER
jgi:ParB family chromosome partitioning protein